MKNRVLSILLVAVLAHSVGLVGCTAEVPEITEYNLTVSSTEGGSVTMPGEGTFTYNEGEKVNLAAIPDEGYKFVNWTGDVGEIANVEDATTSITMKDDYSITAAFAVKQFSLVIHSTEGGSVTTPGENAYAYDKGDVINLVAVADEGYVFINWTGDVGTIAAVDAASTTIAMNGGYSITANFAGAIRDWYDLDAIRDNLDGSYVLMNDLDSTTAGYEELASPTANGGKGWQPIGSVITDPTTTYIAELVAPFAGTFDGQEYEIDDLFVNRSDEDGVGLFGSIGEGGTVENLRLVEAQVTGHLHVGCLVGCNRGRVSDSHSSSSVAGTSDVGGLVGVNDWKGIVGNSSQVGSVTGNWQAGGLLGWNWGTVGNCYASADVSGDSTIGGLVGNAWGSVVNCYFSGSVTGRASIGGLFGSGGPMNNCHYNYEEVLINGRNMITPGALFSEDFERWLANDTFLDINESLSKENGYYVIDNVNDLKQLLAFGQDGSLRFRLRNDLDLHNEANFYVPYLAGEFDGNGHKISNVSFSFSSVSNVGLFGILASSGKISKLGVENVNITGHTNVGSLVGWSIAGTLSDCYSTGSVAGIALVGGLVGYDSGTVTNSYASCTVTGSYCIGGLVNLSDWSPVVSNSYYNYDKVLINGRKVITVGALVERDFDEWLANGKYLDANERLSREGGYYLISGLKDFKELLAFGQNSSLKFRLESDLDLGNESNFYIPYLAGEFDGNGHRISNLSLDFDFVATVGLFGYLASGGRVTRVGVENAKTRGAEHIGGLVGHNRGTVTSSYCSGSVTGAGFVGGLVGLNVGTVSSSYSRSNVVGGGLAGGLVGRNYGPVADCYSDGSVTGTSCVGGLVGHNVGGSVSRSYSVASVSGSDRVGGLVGWNEKGYGGTVSASFWNTQTSGQTTSDGGTGKTTAEMRNIPTFARLGWNIVAVANPSTRNTSYIWNIVDGQAHPFLSWQAVSWQS